MSSDYDSIGIVIVPNYSKMNDHVGTSKKNAANIIRFNVECHTHTN
jgi:hypothetical protein